jgi:RNA polymerase sigma factor (sigma-70 family)
VSAPNERLFFASRGDRFNGRWTISKEEEQPVDPRPEEQVAKTDQQARLMAAIQSLPMSYRQIIVILLEDLSYAEIAEVLGISENNVAVRLNRARKALKEALGVRP